MDEIYEPIAGCCNACKYYDSEPFGKVNYGNCRFFPPVNIQRRTGELPRGIWPVVGYDDYCGKFDTKV